MHCRSDEHGCHGLSDNVMETVIRYVRTVDSHLDLTYNVTGRNSTSSNVIMNRICSAGRNDPIDLDVVSVARTCTDRRFGLRTILR